MLAILQYATSGFWVFFGCLLLIGATLSGIASIVARIMRVPEYPQKCPRCGYDHEKEEDEQPVDSGNALHLTFSSELTNEQIRRALVALSEYYEQSSIRRGRR